jgi:hypothetical protein
LLLIVASGACGSAGSIGDAETGGAASGGNAGAGGLDANRGGAIGTGGGTMGGSGGPDGTGGSSAKCSNTDLDTLPIDAGGRVELACNNWNIQGGWYCFDDKINPTSCIDGKTPYRASAAGMCLSGYTTVDPTFAAYGAALGLSLNAAVGTKSAYDATANGVKGFKIEVTGDLGGSPLLVLFTGSADPGASPFVEVNGTGTFDIPIADARVPETWSVPEAGERASAANLWDIRFQIPGGARAFSYNFCITSVTPLTTSNTGGMGNTGGVGGAGQGGATEAAGAGGAG